MTNLLIAIVLLLLAGGALVWLKKPAPTPQRTQRQATPVVTPAPEAPAPPRPARSAEAGAAAPDRATRPAAVLPVALARFKLVRHEALAAPAAESLLLRLAQIPRPPTSLHKLLSPQFLETANSGDLSDLIMGEAQVAAKVLATVNSPLYGLKRPVASVGQAVTFLGLNTVRSLCLHYMLDDSFKSSSPERRQRFETVLRASSLSSELCSRLAQKLELPEQGALVTQSVLAFLGPLAMTSLLPTDSAAWGPQPDLLTRVRAEQDTLGLGAAELGALLMQTWDLPASIVDNVRDIDSLLVTPADRIDPRRGTRLALCYLSARLGERLAQGQMALGQGQGQGQGGPGPAAGDGNPTLLASYDPQQDTSADLVHLQGYLDAPALRRLPELLQAPALAQSLGNLLGGPVGR